MDYRPPAVRPELLGFYQERTPLYINCSEVTNVYSNGSYQLIYQNCTPLFVRSKQKQVFSVRNMPEIKLKHVVSCSSEDNVLLVTSSFMSPTESRNGTNTNRVRFFGPSQLVKATAQEKWDCVKIVCSQPYSKSLAYGVAFIKLHSPPDADDVPVSTPPKLTKLVSPQNERWSYAAAALNSEGSSAPSSSSSSQQAPVKRKFEFSEDAAGPPPKKPSSSGSSEAKPATPKSKARSGATASPVTSASPAQNTSSDKREGPKPKPEPKPKLKAKSAEPVPFNRILEGVVFVLSGFQNPFRGELRDKALAMGARYRPDWTPDSTHLICAFANTPKYSQVKAAGGVIVRKEWVMDCHKTKKKISSKP
ncbi:hypothetical protein cypCar_00042284 [Cyprinus carpio]|nr:hypothetical protein cypCar_00042284 [Cyprinus carpio]